jgi:APA family basic amino acid/polyamine antiporter
VATIGIAILTAVNCAGVRQGSALQTIITGGKVAAIALLLAMVVAFGSKAAPAAAASSSPFRFVEFVLGVSAALFAFGGWHMVTYSAGETRNPEKTIPRALFIGCLIVTACYIALNAAYLYLLPLDRVTSSARVASDAAFAVAGDRGASIISALVVLSALGVLNGVILAGPRLYLAMSADGTAFRWLSLVHHRFHTPHRALLAQAIWASVLVASGTYRALFTRVVYTEWLFFALMTIGLLRWRRRTGARGGLFVPVTFIGASSVVAGIQIAAEPVQSATGLLLVMVGLPVYCLWVRPRAIRNTPVTEQST